MSCYDDDPRTNRQQREAECASGIGHLTSDKPAGMRTLCLNCKKPAPPAVPADAEMRAIAEKLALRFAYTASIRLGLQKKAAETMTEEIAAALTRLRDETLEAAAQLSERPYGDEVEVIGREEPLAVGKKIAKAIRSLRSAAETPKERT